MADYDTGDWLLDGELGQRVWEGVMKRQNLHWPRSKGSYLELFLDFHPGGETPLRKTRGVESLSGGYVEMEEGTWFEVSDTGYANFDWEFVFGNAGIGRVEFSGVIPTTLGMPFWFEMEEEQEGGPVEVAWVRIPVTEGLGGDPLRKIREWAEGAGARKVEKLPPNWEEDHAVGVAGPPNDRDHWEALVWFDNEEFTTQTEIENVLKAGMDFAGASVGEYDYGRITGGA